MKLEFEPVLSLLAHFCHQKLHHDLIQNAALQELTADPVDMAALAAEREQAGGRQVKRLRLRNDWSDTGPDARLPSPPPQATSQRLSLGNLIVSESKGS